MLTYHPGYLCGRCSATVAVGSIPSRYGLHVQVSFAGTLKRLKRLWFISVHV